MLFKNTIRNSNFFLPALRCLSAAKIEIPGVNIEEVLKFHTMNGKPGKVALLPTKPLQTQKELSLAYSPGVAAPCLYIAQNPSDIYKYTAKGNTVCVVSNGTAVLGLGNIGAGAGKPVMEGKAVLFKRFADIDGCDLEVDTEKVDEIVNCVKFLGHTWGGINLEDIKAPECFEVEEKLKAIMKIPVFHDDQHGTAIVTAAGLINSLEVTNRDPKTTKVCFNGAGAASIAIYNLLLKVGIKKENVIMVDTTGVIYEGRSGLNKYKKLAARPSNETRRSLADAVKDCDVFIGCSVAGAMSTDMLKTMAPNPIVFALANPVPEINPKIAKEARKDVIICTGRSDYPNQINNVLGFPYIFRGTLDVRASQITENMKLAAAKALAGLARKPALPEMEKLFNRKLQFGKEYVIPVPFDPRLAVEVPVAIAKQACLDKVAAEPISDWDAYARSLDIRINKKPTVFAK